MFIDDKKKNVFKLIENLQEEKTYTIFYTKTINFLSANKV